MPKAKSRPRTSSLLVILGDQLFDPRILEDVGPQNTTIFMAEAWDLCTSVRHHKQKIVMFLASMRHYRDELEAAGYAVHYVALSHQVLASPRSFLDHLGDYISSQGIRHLRHFRIADRFFARQLKNFCEERQITPEILPNPSFLTSFEEFGSYLKKVRQPKMQSFYQRQRERLRIMIDADGQPVGGKWSFDTENRKKLPRDCTPPPLPRVTPSSHVRDLCPLVAQLFGNHPGDLPPQDLWFWPVTRRDARHGLKVFLDQRFDDFGPYEDAISLDSDYVFHSVLSPAINMGLLTPSEVIHETLSHAQRTRAPVQSTEGFVRQVIGWREFIHGIDEHYGDREQTGNFFEARRRMAPSWYEGTTGLLPLDHAIKKARRLGYTHHIERLMILSNIMLLCEINPQEVYQWFMEHFVDSAEWVMVPNVYGMGQFADGGLFATKPYICGSNYLLKMSDLERGPWCDVLDGLYWRFIDRHRDFFLSQPRLSMMVHLLAKIPAARQTMIRAKAEDFLARHTYPE